MKKNTSSRHPKNLIHAKLMQLFIEHAITQLEGDWVILGGSVLPLIGLDLRVTVDIDIAQISSPSRKTIAENQSTLTLMDIAQSLGLPVETINQAGSYFLSKIPDANENLILFKQGKSCKIYRPNLYLFIKLKVARLSESDLEDCVAMIDQFPDEHKKDQKRILATIKASLKSATPETQNRRLALLEHCKKIKP
jgi:hypothetical protein